MERAATGLAAGDLDREVNVWSKDELGRMAGAFREMIGYHQRMAAIAEAERLVGEIQVQIAERKRAEQALEHQAFHDALSGLPNRALFADRLEHALARAELSAGG